MKLEEKLVSLRKAKGLSQMKLAEKMNVSRQAISRWETGAAIPSSENLKYLSDLYSVSLDYLLSDYPHYLAVADGLFCREIDGLFCRSSPDIIVRRRCVLSHKRRGWLQPSPSFRYSRNLALQDELYHPVINNGPAVLVCVDKRLGTGPVNQSRDAG